MLKDSQGNRLWIADEYGRHTPVQSHADISGRPRGGTEPDWWVVARDPAWTPPESRSLLSLGATGLSSAADTGGGMKTGAGGHPQPYGWHGYYGETGGGPSSGPEYRGKVTWPNEARGRGTPPAQRGKAVPPPPPAPREPHLTWDQGNGILRDEQDRVMTDKGYSGQGDAKNNPSQEHVEDHGPIPQGNWRIKEITNPNYRTDLTRPIYRLVPDDETRARVEAMGRKPDSILIHGDNAAHDASTGCIIVDRNTRERLRAHAGGWIHVSK